ncbi:type VI secretion system baseplate subunit TssK [Rodentibacter pneumotropicus]|uniref:Type VI secretion system baseplate subunit TssK n=1 Tax=Rodentibacter pneumotropicus TaxID=758 RepID=A0A4S2P5T8_9PAST|nr:type VI secretion system baseplate subunit TssK [Rodentibacter pneumotropicus]OOF62205.1 type VI secretion system-associated protein [Rodentibacter pneumotropicus]TGZ98299.1 type VI secretion system baseplate subunit TssK [Rodentibacter pneumotropicus]THA08603.1 type VI secretion system baseplate subunit TssK [Rodentibacter pneumotropicus]THA10381.1 type VI secretion system baseplate subunit TssK [Rodentibacter pneumotropicus]THA11943.1 type VI secretion system baseplate subunit TssK [Roden
MSLSNRVLWKEGLFIRPQHFQQESRFLTSQLKQIIDISAYNLGFGSLILDQQQLTYGKFALTQCKGVMPDGTLFDLPLTDSLPSPITISSSLIGETIYLCLPLVAIGESEVKCLANNSDMLDSKSEIIFTEIKDIHSENGNYAQIELLKNQYFFKSSLDDLSNYVSLPIAKIKDISLEHQVVLDEDFYPMSLHISAMPLFARKLSELSDLIGLRAQNIVNRIGRPEQSGVADVNDFLMLLTLNRVLPIIKNIVKLGKSHPLSVYEFLASLRSELATFVLKERFSETFYDYLHDNPAQSLNPLFSDIKSYLSVVTNAKVIPLPIVAHQYGIYTAQVNDPLLYSTAEFIIAIKAHLQPELLKNQFVQQTKISSIEQINQLVHLQLPGVPVHALPVAPRYLPYHSGFMYFQLDKTSPYWENLIRSSGFGFHITGDYPGLEIELWAIRGELA